jgi:hypothetical protein
MHWSLLNGRAGNNTRRTPLKKSSNKIRLVLEEKRTFMSLYKERAICKHYRDVAMRNSQQRRRDSSKIRMGIYISVEGS